LLFNKISKLKRGKTSIYCSECAKKKAKSRYDKNHEKIIQKKREKRAEKFGTKKSIIDYTGKNTS